MLRSMMAVLAAGLALTGAGAAMAGQCGYERCWGAVAIGPGGYWAFSHSYPSEAAAIDRAQSECSGYCDNIQTFYNTCGAMAQGTHSAWGFGWAGTRWQAEQNALGYCEQYGNDCAVTVWACSP